MYGCESWTIKKAECWRIDAFELWCWKSTPTESPLDCKEIEPVHPKGNQSWIFVWRTDAEADTPILWPPDVKSWPIWKDPDAGKDWRQEEKGVTEDEMNGWHHRLNRHEFEQAPGVDDGQGGLACCSPWGCKESDTTERLNWTVWPKKYGVKWDAMGMGFCTPPRHPLIVFLISSSLGRMVAPLCLTPGLTPHSPSRQMHTCDSWISSRWDLISTLPPLVSGVRVRMKLLGARPRALDYDSMSRLCYLEGGLPRQRSSENLPAKAGDEGDPGSIPGSGSASGGGDGNPSQYSCLENPMDWGAWWATVHVIAKRLHNGVTGHTHVEG